MVARDIEISKYTGAHVHIAHVSTSQSVDLLKYSKMQDLKVTSEVTHNHLLLNEEACESYSTDTKINPPLPDKNSQKALIEAIKDNTIDMIVSDHAPYAKYEKEVEFEAAPTGISGIETLLSGIIKLSKEQKIDLKDLIEKVTYNPAKIFDLKNIGDIKEGYIADIVIVDTEREWEVTETSLKSKGKNTPFLNTFMPGVVEKVFVNGKIKYEEKELIK
jgi:dihydroorotase